MRAMMVQQGLKVSIHHLMQQLCTEGPAAEALLTMASGTQLRLRARGAPLAVEKETMQAPMAQEAVEVEAVAM